MWCPICKDEYVEGISECATCRAPLVEQLPEDEENIPSEWVVAEEFTDEIAANLAEGLLQENGIDCRQENISFHAEPIPVSGSFCRVRIWVAPDDLEEAKKMLADADNYDLCEECGSVVLKEDEECSECGAKLEGEE